MERRAKTEQARMETEAILADQAEQVRLRKVEMEKRDAERMKRMDLEAKERAALNQEKRKKADLRITSEGGRGGEREGEGRGGHAWQRRLTSDLRIFSN